MYCPLKFQMIKEEGRYGIIVGDPTECERYNCAWWVQPYTTEQLPTYGICAISMIAMKAPAHLQV